MRPIGFSTGALAKGNFKRGIEILRRCNTKIVELSALRQHELGPLMSAIDDLDLTSFSYISIHAPSRIAPGAENETIMQLSSIIERRWPVIVHPDAMADFKAWAVFGDLLCIENTDIRKSIGRTARELTTVFEALPEACFCFDIGHARQVDPTMSEAAFILQTFGGRLRQLHASEVNSSSNHEPLTFASTRAFSKVSYLIPEEVPVVLETPVEEKDVLSEIACVRRALPTSIEAVRKVV